MANESIRIRDLRGGDYFRIHNIVIDTYGKLLQPAGIAVYATLCRMADNDDQTCYPSYQTIATRIGISRSKVGTVLRLLQDIGLVGWESGKETHSANTYILINPPVRVSWADTSDQVRVSPQVTPDLPEDTVVTSQETPTILIEQDSTNKTHEGSAAEHPFTPAPVRTHDSAQVTRKKTGSKVHSVAHKPAHRADTTETRICSVHSATMFGRDNNTRFSHQLADGSWCNGTVPDPTTGGVEKFLAQDNVPEHIRQVLEGDL